MTARKRTFKSEVSQLMHILVHSLYKERDVFLRELISNATDAINRFRVVQMSGEDVVAPDREHRIDIEMDKDHALLTIKDSGIGMNEQELAEQLGTIARSGSLAMLKSLKDEDAARDLIGRFGVGFYAVFMVAEQVTVRSRSFRPGDAPAQWQSRGETGFVVESLDQGVDPGTEVTLKLKEDAREYLEPSRIQAILTRYSRFAPFPLTVQGEPVDRGTPLWLEQPSAVTDEQYTSFYGYLSHGEQNPMTWLHIHSDAPVDVKSILYVPGFSMARFGMEDEGGIALYARKVLIDARTEGLVPDWCRFMKGVVDSEDVQLNVSRETIQNDPVYRRIRKVVGSRVAKHLKSWMDRDRSAYEAFYDEFGGYLKEGMVRDPEAQKSLADLLLFSATDRKELLSLREYLDATPEKEAIHYLVGTNRKTLESNPHLEWFRRHETPVLLLTQPIEELALTDLGAYEDVPFKLVGQDSGEGDEAATGDMGADPLLAFVRETLTDRVNDVRYSNRLEENPYCILSTSGGLSSTMEQIMRAMQQSEGASKGVLELNAEHPMISRMREWVEATPDSERKGRLRTIAHQIMDNALLLDQQLPDVTEMVRRSNALMLAYLADDPGTGQ